ncbi:MAG TPA: MBL fold metallo-hydrolase [Vicinamibacterales bacterium]|nr:MBL fold metallo-hydrolase [Vicinamibacterales bacterium]
MITRYATVLVASLLCACAPATQEQQVIDDAVEAMGGAGRIREVKALTIQGTGTAPNAGQNRTPEDELPVWKVTEYTRRIDLVNWRTRVQQVREAQFLFAGELVQRQTQGIDGDAAYNVSASGTVSRAGAAAARDRRSELLHHPVTFLKTIVDADITLSNLRARAGERLVDIAMPDGGTMTLGIDAATHLPTRVVSMAANPNMGDVAIETRFSDYEEVGGLKLPRRLTTKMDYYLQLDLQVAKNAVDGDMSDLALSAALRQAKAPEPSPVVVTVEPVAKGIWWLAGSGNHRSVVFEFDDHLVLFEAPVNEARTKAVIDKARTLSPKPLTKAIVSHHHFDHSGGLRVAIAEGLTIVTHRSNEAFFTSLVARQHTIAPDTLEKVRRLVTFELVDDQLTLKDESMEVQLYHLLDNPREGTNIYAYVPRDRILVQADLYDATWLRHSWGENVLRNLERRGLKIERSVPVHGVIEPFDQMVRNIKSKPS